MKKTKGSIKRAPQLAALPPTKEAFELNVRRGHLQCAVWKHAMSQDPPDVDETAYGYEKNLDEKTLQPATLPPGVNIIPPEVQKILCCNCKANEPCSKGNCTCRLAGISCTDFCNCFTLLRSCKNPYTVLLDETENPEEKEVLEEKETRD